MRFILAFLLLTTPALAVPCGPHDEMTAGLKRSYGEVAQVQAMSGDGRMLEMFANLDTGTWTAMLTAPDGTACLAAAGDQYRAAKPGNPA